MTESTATTRQDGVNNSQTSILKNQINALAEPYAFALIRWPAVVGLMSELPVSWPDAVRILLGIWLAAMVLAAYGQGRGWGFGNLMLFLDGVITLACMGHPSPWILAWLPLLFIGLFAAQHARLRVIKAEFKATSQTEDEMDVNTVPDKADKGADTEVSPCS